MSLLSGSSKVSIISQAFTDLGKEEPTNDLINESPTTAAASKRYDTLLLNEFTNHPWRFAMVPGVELSKLVDPPPIQKWQFQYQLPEGFLSLYRLHPLEYTDFIIYKDKIFTNIDNPLSMDYLTKVAESEFPAYFVELMIKVMAANMALQFTQDVNISALAKQDLIAQRGIARNLDSQIMPNPFVRSNDIWAAHLGL